jgi:hypothetical protein
MPVTILNEGTEPPADVDDRIRALHAYWRAIRRNRRFPSRTDFDPIDIPALMPFVSIVDVRRDALPRFVYRLVGTQLVDLLKKEVTGHPVGYGVKPEELESVLRRYEIVADAGVAVFQRDKTQEQSNDFTGVERLMLPLGAGDSRVDMILSIVVPLVGFAPAG